jgi:hypothetical protein
MGVNGVEMTIGEKVLVHQIHSVKLATDVAASILSTWLFWGHQVGWGLAAMWVPPVIASAVVLRFVPLERYRDSAAGRYVLRYMTPSAQAVRFVGAILMAWGAWARSWWFIVFGLAVIAAAWSRGLWRRIG